MQKLCAGAPAALWLPQEVVLADVNRGGHLQALAWDMTRALDAVCRHTTAHRDTAAVCTGSATDWQPNWSCTASPTLQRCVNSLT